MSTRTHKPTPKTKLEPSLMREFVLTWILRQHNSEGEYWSLSDLARHLGVNKGTVSRIFAGQSRYSRHGGWDDYYLPRIAQFLGVSPMHIYGAALRMWQRDPEGESLEAFEDG